MAVPYKLNYFEIESGLGTTSTFLHKGDLTANRIIKIGGTSNDILLGDGSTGSLSGKQNTITLTTSGTSGAATLIGATLNIPNYSPDLTGYVTLGTTQTITGAKTFGATITSNRINATATGSGAAVISALAFDNAVAGSFSNTTTFLQNNPTLFVQQGGDGRIALFQSGTANVVIESDGDINGIKDLTLTSAIKKSTIGATYTYDLPNANGTIALVGGAGVGTVTSVAALTLGTTGTDLSSTVADGTTTPVITLNVPTASATNRGALSSADWSEFNGKQAAGNYITSLTGEATASGPGAASVTLDNTAVIGKVLTGLNVTGGTVVSTDSILTALGKVQNQINGLIGGSIFQGVWDASTNNPALASSVGTNGYYYIVSVAGSTNLNGITDWKVGDWAIFAGTTWQKVDNTDAVSSVNGYTGTVSLVTGDVLEGAGSLPSRPSQLYFTDARARAAISLTTTGSSGAATYDNGTGVLNIPNYGSALSGYVPYTGATTNVDLGTNELLGKYLVANGAAALGGVLSIKQDAAYLAKGNGYSSIASSNIMFDFFGYTGASTYKNFALKFNGLTDNTRREYTLPDASGTLALTSDIPSLTGYVTLDTAQTITGAKTLTSLLTGTRANFTSSGSGDTLGINHSSGSGIALYITKAGNGEGIYVNKSSGSGNAVTIVGTLNATTIVKNGGTSSQFLKADGSVDSTSYQPLLTNPVTGTGTTNYVPKFTGASTIGNSLIYDNGTAVGIGTTTPNYLFQVKKATNVNFGINLQNAGISLEATNDAITAYIPMTYYASAHYLLDGNVGINTIANAGFRLDVNGTARFTSSIALTSASSSSSLTSTTNGIEISVDGSTTSNKNTIFKVGSSETMRIDASGNLGLGTTSPGTKLHVLANSAVDEGNAAAIIRQGGGNNNNGLLVDVTNSVNAYIADFRQGNSSLMRFTGAGNLGIGTTSPSSLLHLIKALGNDVISIGESGNNARLKIGQESGYTGNYIDSTNIDLKLLSNLAGGTGGNIILYTGSSGVNTERMRITSGGNVLIGTTTDNGSKLQVQGNTTSGISYRIGTYTNGSTTPSVSGISFLSISNSSATSITNFTGAVDGQIITLQFSDSNTTITRNNAYLSLGLNFTSTANDTITLIYFNGLWYEVSRSVNS